MSGGDHHIKNVVTQGEKKKRNTCVEWNGNNHDCYPSKCCPSKKIEQRDDGQSNLGRSGTRNSNLY